MPYSFVLQPKSIEPFLTDTYAATSVIQYSMNSTTQRHRRVDDRFEFSTFRTSATRGGIVGDSIYYQNGTSSQNNWQVPPGDYYLIVFAYGTTANTTLSLQIYPNNPFVLGTLGSPQPSGIASYGLTNSSGVDSPYAVRSTDVAGVVDVSAMQAYNSTAESATQVPTSSASLQLNSVLVVNEAGGKSRSYWVQNTPPSYSNGQVELADNLWNFSSSGFLRGSTVTSEGGKGASTAIRRMG